MFKGRRKLDNRVCFSKAGSYDPDELAVIIKNHFDMLGLNREFFAGKKVAIKPNLVADKSPDTATTTHPNVILAVTKILNEYSITPILAESPGGTYTPGRMKNTYKACGLNPLLEKCDIVFNYDTSSCVMENPDGKTVKMFNIIKPIYEADVIIDIGKLKSHTLTTMTSTVKNLFGTIPGIEKFEFHASHPGYESFAETIVDLCSGLMRNRTVIAITDAILCMEGDGPTAGTPRFLGALTTSVNPFASDELSEYVLGIENRVYMVQEARNRNFIPQDVSGLEIIGDNPDELRINDFKLGTLESGSASVKLLNFLSKSSMGRYFMPRPYVTDKCVGCMTCARNCPVQTITKDAKTNRAKINTSKCIRCYCCQELCPISAVTVKTNFILKLLK